MSERVDGTDDDELIMRIPGVREWIERHRASPAVPVSELLTVRRAAEYVGIAQSTLYTHIYRGSGPRQELDRPRRFSSADLDDWIENRSTPPGRRKNE